MEHLSQSVMGIDTCNVIYLYIDGKKCLEKM